MKTLFGGRLNLHLEVVHSLMLKEVDLLPRAQVLDVAVIPLELDFVAIFNQAADTEDRSFHTDVVKLDFNVRDVLDIASDFN